MESADGKGEAQLSFISQHLVTIQQNATEKTPGNKGTGGWGGAENRPSENDPAGRQYSNNPDPPLGTLISPCFRIVGRDISFIIGGGCTINDIRAELIVDKQVRLFTLTIMCPLILLKQLK